MTTDSLKSAMKATMLAVIIVALTSCTKSGLDTMAGRYTYKTSGMVTLIPTEIANLSSKEVAEYKERGGTIDTLVLALAPEQGQMNIAVTDRDKSSVFISWNVFLGNVSTAGATVSGTRLSLEKSTKTVALKKGSVTIGEGIVDFTGEGDLYSSVLNLEMKYEGTFTVQKGLVSISMTIIDSKVECVANANI